MIKIFKNWSIDPNKRLWITKFGCVLYNFGLFLQQQSSILLRFINQSTIDDMSDWFIRERKSLNKEIRDILIRQKKEYPHHTYFYGYPYQGLAIAGIYGERPTEERFETYNLAEHFSKDDYILDIGCNCGFVGIYTAFRLNCRVKGIDINPYMIEIGQKVAKHLRIEKNVELIANSFHHFSDNPIYSGVFSFATHWTDDEQYRVSLSEHLLKIHSLLKKQGKLIFESHCNDVGQSKFYESLEQAKQYFDIKSLGTSDNNSREIYLMIKK